jgi:MinD superfamily P-loop ATPase
LPDRVLKELVVISGKGGTGKTSIVASFAALAGPVVTADCDVDAADLHLLLDPKIERREPFPGGLKAAIDAEKCTSCGKCLELCRFGAVQAANSIYSIDEIACEGCGVCAYFCPEDAISLEVEDGGEWFVSSTRFGPMSHARLKAGGENSGKLVTIVRREAKRLAVENGLGLILADGSPGIGCPVIASVTGADYALVVTEPSASGFHDLERVIDLADHFDIETAILVNKCDINKEMTENIERFARKKGLLFAGGVRYDESVTGAQMVGKSTIESSSGPAAEDIRLAWERIAEKL